MPYEGMIAETVNINGHNGDQIDAYLARPLGAGPFPGVVLIHHMPGWDEASKEMARKLAYNGYVCISPNLHFREGQGDPTANSASVREAGGMPDDRTLGDVAAARDYLLTTTTRLASSASAPAAVRPTWSPAAWTASTRRSTAGAAA